MKKFESLNDSKFASAALSKAQMYTVKGGTATGGGSRNMCVNGSSSYCRTYTGDCEDGGGIEYYGGDITEGDCAKSAGVAVDALTAEV